MFWMSSSREVPVTATTSTDPQAPGDQGSPVVPRLVVAAPALDHVDLIAVMEAFCGLGDDAAATLVVATTEPPDQVASVLLASCRHLDLGAAGPIDLVQVDDISPLGPGELGLYLGGDHARAHLSAALGWLAARRPRLASPVAAAPPVSPSVPTIASPLTAVESPQATRTPPPLAVALGHPTDVSGRVAHLERELGPERRAVRRLGQPARADGYRRVAEVCRPLGWIDGYLSLTDAQFLYDVVAAARPTRLIEVGSASGYSAAVALRALADVDVPLVAADGRPAILSFDIATHCYWDASRRIGGAVTELVPDLAHGVQFIEGTSLDASALPAASASLAFVDANHEHPWASLDVLLLARVLRPGSWIVLHDVRLGACAELYREITGTAVEWDQRGAQHLYDHWPFERLIERISPSTNIAAIRLPGDRVVGIADIHDALAQPWQCEVPEPVVAAVRARG
jgi:predicted O-methyltransferase YrrM